MLKKIQERIFPFIIATSALSVSASAAFYSVSGLSKLFAGAAFAVIIMAASLEVAKLVIASLLYQYRKTLPRGLKIYLTTAAFVLVLITSMGIYGFLSAAYQETANKAGNIDAQVALVETKRDNVQKQLDVYNIEKENTDKAIADLRAGLSNNVITYTNAQGQLITSTSSATRKALERQLDQAIERQTELNSKVDGLNTQLFDYETEIVGIKTGNDLAGELGPLKYLSGLTGVPMDKIINILLLTIIFVFDPLAIALVIAANFAFEQIRKKYKENLYGEKVPIEEQVEDMRKVVNTYDALNELARIQEEEGLYDNEGSDIYTEDELSDWDSTLMDGLEDEEWDKEPIGLKKKASNEEIENLFENWEEPIKESFEDPSTAFTDGYVKEYDEFDLNQDGIIDESEINQIKDRIKSLEQQFVPGLSTFRKNKITAEISRLKSKLPSDDDLTITY